MIIGFVLGFLFTLFGSTAWVWWKFHSLRDEPCSACGREPAVLAQIVDLETRQPRAMSLLCEACSIHARNVVLNQPAPWAKNWR